MAENQKFDLSALGIKSLEPKRPIIGNFVPVVLWRLIRLIGLHNILQEETPVVTYLLGKNIGKMLEVSSVEKLQEELVNLKVGVIDVPVNTGEEVNVSIRECVTCAGITPPIGQPICQLEAGIVAGALEKINPGKKVTAIETKCIGGLGDDTCLIECRII